MAENTTKGQPKQHSADTLEKIRTHRETYLAKHGPKARQTNADIRAINGEEITPKQQLAELNTRLGVGIGAAKERKRLQKLIAAGKGDLPYRVVKTQPAGKVEKQDEPELVAA